MILSFSRLSLSFDWLSLRFQQLSSQIGNVVAVDTIAIVHWLRRHTETLVAALVHVYRYGVSCGIKLFVEKESNKKKYIFSFHCILVIALFTSFRARARILLFALLQGSKIT